MKCSQMINNFPFNRLVFQKICMYRYGIGRNWISKVPAIMPCPCVEKNPCVPDICDVGNLTSVPPRVVIIGAGLAGLSAAQKLIQCGISDVIILEAAPRPGGRIYTCECERAPVDLGAQWIYGGSVSNLMFNLACQEGLIKHPIEIYSPYRGVYLNSHGDVIKTYIRRKAIMEFDNIHNNAKALYRKGSGTKETGTLWEYLNQNIIKALDEKFTEGERESVSRVMYGLTNDIKTRLGENLDRIPARKYGAYMEIPGGYTAIKRGFITLLEPMIASIPAEKIKYRKAVKSIKWKHSMQEEKRAEIFCCDGSIFDADFVICTASLGVLKRHYQELFCPNLPPEKVEAIKNLGFGNVIKIYLEYEQPFWFPTEGKFRLSWSKDEMEVNDWVNSIGLIEEAPSCGNSLLVTVGGDEANCLETISTTQVVERITNLIRTFLNNKTIPYPKNVLRSNWGQNAFTIGSVTYLGKESHAGHIKELASPLPGPADSLAPVLLFAGEATASGQYSTVQGARLTGVREAERILMITRRFNGKPKPDSFSTCI